MSPAPLAIRGRFFAIVLVVFLIGFLSGSTGRAASSGPTPQGISLAISLSRTSSDALLIGDSRPTALGTVGGSIELGLPACRGWQFVAGGQIGGNWYDFNNGSQNTGNITVILPGLRLGVNKYFRVSERLQGRIGGAFEYSEVRSWTHSRIIFLPYDVTGPRNFRRGGVVRAAIEGRSASCVMPFVEISEGALLAQASAQSFSAKYHWLTYSTSVSFGLRLRLTKVPQEP